MARNKLHKFAEVKKMPNIIEHTSTSAKINLNKFLKKFQTVVLELGCGRGDYAIALARLFDDVGIVGIDIQGERLWYGARQASQEKLDNVIFLRTQIDELSRWLPKNSVDKIWITFPDPFPRDKQIKKRLTSPKFLNIYKTILKPGGRVHLKTDDQNLFTYSQDSVAESGGKITKKIADIYNSGQLNKLLEIQTHFEKKHLAKGKKIYYLSWEY